MTGQTSAMMAIRDPDVRLMLRVRDGDRAAFAELVGLYQHRLVGIMHHLVGNVDEAEDLAQEVFLRVYRTRETYSPKAKFSTWLFRIANNLALNAHRDRRRRPVVRLAGDADEAGPGDRLADHRDPPPAHRLDQQELEQVIRRALDGLNARQRMAVVLNKFEDMGYHEIGEVMGLTEKAVKSLLSRARCRLREALQAYVDPDGVYGADGVDNDAVDAGDG